MTLEEKLRAYAAKGELVHLSVVCSPGAAGKFHAKFASATPAYGYSSGESDDPVEAIEQALKASPAKTARVSKKTDIERMAELSGGEEGGKVTATVKDGALRSDWTTP